jgi:hypothetical protein
MSLSPTSPKPAASERRELVDYLLTLDNASLTERQASVLFRREQGETGDQIATALGTNRSHVRRLEVKAYAALGKLDAAGIAALRSNGAPNLADKLADSYPQREAAQRMQVAEDSIALLNLPSVIANQLAKLNITNVPKLLAHSREELMSKPGMGKKSVDAIVDALKQRGESLAERDILDLL